MSVNPSVLRSVFLPSSSELSFSTGNVIEYLFYISSFCIVIVVALGLSKVGILKFIKIKFFLTLCDCNVILYSSKEYLLLMGFINVLSLSMYVCLSGFWVSVRLCVCLPVLLFQFVFLSLFYGQFVLVSNQTPLNGKSVL